MPKKKTVVLYFSDELNLKAFVLLEGITDVRVQHGASLVEGRLCEAQIRRALDTYKAELKT
jgi:hypothetical protein